MQKLHVITPTMRHNKLPVLANSISGIIVPDGWAIEWRVRFMPRRTLPEPEFSPRRDDLLWGITDGWWIYVSDDNLIHRELLQKLDRIVKERPADQPIRCIMFAQRCNSSITRPGTVEQLTTGDCECDGGAFVMNAAFYSGRRLKYHQFGLMERYLFKAIHDEAPGEFVFCNEPLTFKDGQGFIFDP